MTEVLDVSDEEGKTSIQSSTTPVMFLHKGKSPFFFRDEAGYVDDRILTFKVTFSPLFQYIYFCRGSGGQGAVLISIFFSGIISFS